MLAFLRCARVSRERTENRPIKDQKKPTNLSASTLNLTNFKRPRTSPKKEQKRPFKGAKET